ncbi:MAG TPA: AAA family ATPase [Solirubrobacteraceae bacterium]
MADTKPRVNRRAQDHQALALEWRRLTRAATFVAVLTSPMVFSVLFYTHRWSFVAAVIGTLVSVIAFRGLIDVVAHRLIPRPSLYAADRQLLDDDAIARRRVWYWRKKFRHTLWLVGIFGGFLLVINLIQNATGSPRDLGGTVSGITGVFGGQNGTSFVLIGAQIPLLFLANFLIFFGPIILMAVRSMKGYEPGDADWGVKIDDVRGQSEPKEEITRVISLWESGEDFRKAGGKPERGLLFIGSPGTGKTMLSKAIATSFNSPIVIMPGSGFQMPFMGMDVIVVQLMISKARRLARKWGGQCIIFIDEIDAVGLRRAALGGGAGGMMTPASTVDSFHDLAFFGSQGALNSSGDLILETRAWREKLFAARASAQVSPYPDGLLRIGARIQDFIFPGGGMMGGGMGGGLALNQLLVQMDGVDDPPFTRKIMTNRVNTFLDATYILPPKIGRLKLRLRAPKPRAEQIYFIGATNVPIDRLDPALIRPGRMGRHIWFRTPTKDDRKDIFDLYMDRVDHAAELDTEKRRDELARITNGYSPAMIEQVCSMALTYAHSDERVEFEWADLVEAMTTIESGTAQGVDYIPEETRAVAIHEAGHAAASHVYMQGVLSTRLSIRKRGGSLGHHQAIEKEERFSSWRHEEVGKLVWTLGAMAAEHVFYGENSTGVGGDVQSATARAAWMVGMCGMGPEPIDFNGHEFPDDDERTKAAEMYMDRFEQIGAKIINRSGGSALMGDPIPAILGDRNKNRAAAQILGQAYITAYCLILHNREQVQNIAETLISRRELHGDEVVDVLDAARLEAPAIDITDDASWPNL